jgi:hypothetical protein
VIQGEDYRLLHQAQSPDDLILVAMKGSADERKGGVNEKIIELSETTEIVSSAIDATPVTSGTPWLWDEWDM